MSADEHLLAQADHVIQLLRDVGRIDEAEVIQRLKECSSTVAATMSAVQIPRKHCAHLQQQHNPQQYVVPAHSSVVMRTLIGGENRTSYGWHVEVLLCEFCSGNLWSTLMRTPFYALDAPQRNR